MQAALKVCREGTARCSDTSSHRHQLILRTDLTVLFDVFVYDLLQVQTVVLDFRF